MITQMVIYLIHEGDLTHAIIQKQPLTVLELDMMMKVGINSILFLLYRQMIVKVYDYLYCVITMLHSDIFMQVEEVN